MFKIAAIDKIKWSKKAMPVIKRIATSKSEREKLITMLRDNGYDEFADISEDFVQKYGVQAKKFFS